MATVPDPVSALLDKALVAELTVVDGHGRPVTYPLIPLWDGEKVYLTSSTLFSRKLEHIKANAKVSLGKEVEVTVRLARQFDLPLPLKVEAILPPNVKGITAKEVTIKSGEEEAKVVFVVAPTATIGQTPTITIRATAMFNDTIPVVHETKVTLSIAK